MVKFDGFCVSSGYKWLVSEKVVKRKKEDCRTRTRSWSAEVLVLMKKRIKVQPIWAIHYSVLA